MVLLLSPQGSHALRLMYLILLAKQALEVVHFAGSWYTMAMSFLSFLLLQHAGDGDGVLKVNVIG